MAKAHPMCMTGLNTESLPSSEMREQCVNQHCKVLSFYSSKKHSVKYFSATFSIKCFL